MYQSVNLRARQISRGNKDLMHRTFHETKMIIATRKWSMAYPYSNYWVGNPLPHIPRITFKSILEYFATSMSCNEGTLFKLRMFSYTFWLKLVGKYVDQTFTGFLSDLIWSSQLEKQSHIAYY